MPLSFLTVLIFSLGFFISKTGAQKYHAIRVVDNSTKRGVPLVTLRTTNDLTFVTDSNGYVAFYEEYLMNQPIWFYVESPGYQHDEIWGMKGKIVTTTPGATTTLYLKRNNTAVRLYRLTGAGIYRDSSLLGLETPIRNPLINSGVLGLDSTISAIYKNKIYWFWGDTNRASFPLGNFHVTGATSDLVHNGGLDPNIGVNFDYFQMIQFNHNAINFKIQKMFFGFNLQEMIVNLPNRIKELTMLIYIKIQF